MVYRMSYHNVGFWRLLFIISLVIAVISLFSLTRLYENISGDSIPNRPQKEPPIVYRWDLAIIRIIVSGISFFIASYSFKKIRVP